MPEAPAGPASPQSLLDRMAIRELHEAYADAVLRADSKDWARCWAEDGEWTIFDQTVRGREAIVGLWVEAMSVYRAASFIAAPGPIVINGDNAHGRCQTHEFLEQKSGSRQFIGGAYEDRFVRRDGTWLFASRVYRIVADITFPADQEPV